MRLFDYRVVANLQRSGSLPLPGTPALAQQVLGKRAVILFERGETDLAGRAGEPQTKRLPFLIWHLPTFVKIWVIDNGGQWTHREWRVLRYLKQETEMVDNKMPLEELQAAELDGLLLSGGAPRVGVDGELGSCGEYVDGLDIPILGICAGLQFMARHFGGDAAPGNPPEFGAVEMEVLEEGDILRDVPKLSTVWESHHDEVSVVPDSFQVLAKSETCPVQVMRHKDRPLFGTQFHPEVEHTEAGVTIFENFIRICEERQK
jgi:GMP synthase (glutamine-hydrolysing)